MAVEDKTGAISIVRMIDRVNIAGQAPEMPPSPVKITLVLALKAGFMHQKAMLRIKPVPPSGKDLPPIELGVLFEGGERGVQCVFPLQMILNEEGLYWFDVSVDDQPLTRIALRLLYQRIATAGKPEPQPGG
jgi:hypothetical protein